MKFSVNHDRVYIIPDPKVDKTESGIFVPENSGVDQNHVRFGTVVAVGNGHRSEATGEQIPIDFEEGDRVFFHRMQDESWVVDGTEYLCLRPHEIFGTVDTSLSAVE